MILPVAHQTAQQVGTAQERAVLRRFRTHDDMIATTGAGVATIDHEFLGAESGEACFVVKRLGDIHHFVPALRRLHVHFDHARVRRDFEHMNAWVKRWRVTFNDNRLVKRQCDIFHSS